MQLKGVSPDSVLMVGCIGAQSVKKAGLAGVGYVFVKPPSMQELEDRLRGRGTETEDKILKRCCHCVLDGQYVVCCFRKACVCCVQVGKCSG